MIDSQRRGRVWTAALATALLSGLSLSSAHGDEPIAPPTDPASLRAAKKVAEQPPVPPPPAKTKAVDHSGRRQKGDASIYADKFAGRKTADGDRLDMKDHVAASKTLPLGTVAKVTNLETGKATEVEVKDRGPFVSGRVVDLTPGAAKAIGLSKHDGVAPVVVSPVAVPQPDGSVKAGAGAAENAGLVSSPAAGGTTE